MSSGGSSSLNWVQEINSGSVVTFFMVRCTVGWKMVGCRVSGCTCMSGWDDVIEFLLLGFWRVEERFLALAAARVRGKWR